LNRVRSSFGSRPQRLKPNVIFAEAGTFETVPSQGQNGAENRAGLKARPYETIDPNDGGAIFRRCLTCRLMAFGLVTRLVLAALG